MAEKIFNNVRLGLKVDTLENWGNSTLALKKGEIAIATAAASVGTGLTEPVCMIKIGEDGVKTFKDIEWNFYAKASDVLAACKTEAGLKSFIKTVITEAGVATGDGLAQLAERVTTAEGGITKLNGLVGDTAVATQIANAIADLKLADTYEAKGEAAKVSAALESYKTTNNAAVTANTNAIAGIKDGESIDSFADVEAALAGKQATGDYATKAEAQGYADAKDEAIAAAKKAGDDAQADVDALAAKVGTVADGKTVVDMIADAQEAATYDDTDVKADIAGLKGLVGDTAVATQISTEVEKEKTRAEGIEAGLRTDVDAIKGDYLKAADKEALQNQINTIMNNPDAEGAINSINEFTQYVKDHGTVAEGMRTDINKNKEDIAAEVTRATGVESGLDTRLQAVEAAVGESGSVAGDIADALAEAKKYTDDEVKELAEGAVATNAGDIAALKTKVGDKAVSEQITDVTNPLAERVVALEAIDHEHANATVLDGITSDKVAGWDAKVDSVTAVANSGLKATTTGNAVVIDFDDTITFVLDCGTSAE